jgi:hypothetical protein
MKRFYFSFILFYLVLFNTSYSQRLVPPPKMPTQAIWAQVLDIGYGGSEPYTVFLDAIPRKNVRALITDLILPNGNIVYVSTDALNGAGLVVSCYEGSTGNLKWHTNLIEANNAKFFTNYSGSNTLEYKNGKILLFGSELIGLEKFKYCKITIDANTGSFEKDSGGSNPFLLKGYGLNVVRLNQDEQLLQNVDSLDSNWKGGFVHKFKSDAVSKNDIINTFRTPSAPNLSPDPGYIYEVLKNGNILAAGSENDNSFLISRYVFMVLDKNFNIIKSQDLSPYINFTHTDLDFTRVFVVNDLIYFHAGEEIVCLNQNLDIQWVKNDLKLTYFSIFEYKDKVMMYYFIDKGPNLGRHSFVYLDQNGVHKEVFGFDKVFNEAFWFYTFRNDAEGNLFTGGRCKLEKDFLGTDYSAIEYDFAMKFPASYFSVSSSSDISDALEVKIFPNPTSGDFRIETNGSGLLNIQDVHGKIMKQINLTGDGSQEISAQDLSSGIYFLQTVSQDGTRSRAQKLVKM